MTQAIAALADVADRYGAIILDQWGVLHDGSAPYPGVPEAVSRLARRGQRLAVLSNSGKRAVVNAQRIAALGYDVSHFEVVMTSGEAFWCDIVDNLIAPGAMVPITAKPGDAHRWADGADAVLVDDVKDADAVLLMGLPEGEHPATAQAILNQALANNLPVYCTNPDRGSPRAGGTAQVAPGALAHKYAARGGAVEFYGKPHAPIFAALARAMGLPPERMLMVGDSLEHDVAGAAAAGWDSVFITGGLHAAAFKSGDEMADLNQLAGDGPRPTYLMPHVR